ncbi:unnamed protein product [Sphagnum tenellum]
MTSLYRCTGKGNGVDTFATTALNWEYGLCSLKPPWKKPEIRAHVTVRISPGSWNQIWRSGKRRHRRHQRLASDSKAGAEPDFGQAGPLLGSCLSSPSSAIIISQANSMRLLLGEEVFQDQIAGDDERKAPAFVNEK